MKLFNINFTDCCQYYVFDNRIYFQYHSYLTYYYVCFMYLNNRVYNVRGRLILTNPEFEIC